MFNIRGWEWIIILAVILLLFGPKQLPNLARSLGKTITEFRTGIKGIEDDVKNLAKEPEPKTGPPPPDKDEKKKEPVKEAAPDEPEALTPEPDYPEEA